MIWLFRCSISHDYLQWSVRRHSEKGR